MKERTTRFRLLNPILTKEELLNHMGSKPIPTDYYRVSFEDRSLGNRCAPDLVAKAISTIKPNELHKWKFEPSGDLGYREALKKIAKNLGAENIDVDRHKIPKWIQITSKQKRHLHHEKLCQLLGQRLRRQEIVLVEPIFCAETDDRIVCPTREEWLRSIGVPKLETKEVGV